MMQRLAIAIGVLLLLGALVMMLQRPRESPPAEVALTDSPGGAQSDSLRAEGPLPSKSPPSRRGANSAGPLYSGPSSLAEWTVKSVETGSEADAPAWKFFDGELGTEEGGTLAREIVLPEMAKFSFHLEWATALRFRVILMADSGRAQPDNSYEIIFQRRFAYLRKRWMTENGRTSRIVGQCVIPALAEGHEALFEILLSRENGTISLFVNGNRAEVWRDEEHVEGAFGNWFQLIAEEYYPVEVSGIVAERWDGLFPDPTDRGAPYFDPDPDWVKKLEPGTWPADVVYQQERQRIRARLEAALETAEGPERNVAQHAAVRATVEAQRRYNEAVLLLPEAARDEQRPGYVINPFTGDSLDVRGVPSGSRVRDPRSGRSDQVFRVP